MPIKRGRKYGRRRRRAIRRTRGFTRRVAGAVARIAEKKFTMQTFGTFTTPIMLNNVNGSYYNPIENLTQGSGVTNRVGNRIYLRKSKIRLMVSFNFNSTLISNTLNFGYRILIGWYKNNAYVNQPIFDSLGVITAADYWLAPIDTDKFFVKKDKIYSLMNSYNLPQTNVVMFRTHNIRIKWNHACQWNDNLTGAASQSWLPAVILIPNLAQSTGIPLADRNNSFISVGSMISTFTDI